MSNDFLANVQQEDGTQIGDNIAISGPKTDEKVTSEPSAPPADNEPKTEQPSQGGDNTLDGKNLPFHQHPRWIEREKELKDLRERNTKYETELQTVKQILGDRIAPPQQTQTVVPQIPKWFQAAYGNDQELWKDYLDSNQGIKAQLKQELLNEQAQAIQAAEAEKQKWEGWVKDGLKSLHDEGLEFDDNELQKVALDYLPSDEEGNIDFRRAYKIMQQLKSNEAAPQREKLDAKKALADTTTAKPRSERTAPKFETPGSIRNRSWDNLLE